MIPDPSRGPTRRRIWSVAAAALVFLALPRGADAGAWAREENGLYLKVSAAYSFADEQFKEGGEALELLSTNEDGSLQSTALRLYAEYGLLPRLTYIASGSVVRHRVDSELVRITTTGLADLRTGFKYQFLDDPFVASVASMWTIPTGYTAEPDNPKVPTLGLGVPMHNAQLLVGKSLHPIPLYISAQAGIRVRFSRELSNGDRLSFPPELPYAAELGVNATDWMTIVGRVRGLKGFGDPEDLNVFTLSPTTQSYLKFGPSLIFTLRDRIQFNFDFLYTASGVNSLRSLDLGAGVALEHAF